MGALAYDEGDFRQDILQYSSFMRALALALVRDPNKADDLVQAAYLKAIQRPPENRTRHVVHAFLRTTILRVFWQDNRSDERLLAREKAAAKSEALPDVLESMENDSVVLAITPAIEALPPKLKAVITRWYFRSMKPRAIAAELKTTPKDVKQRHDEALEKMRKRLDRQFNDRDTWCAALIPVCLARPAPVPVATSGTGILVAAGVAVVALVGAGVFLWSGGSKPSHADEGPTVAKMAVVETPLAARDGGMPQLAPPFDDEATEAIRGRVVDASTGAGVAGVRIGAVSTARPLPREVTPDDPFAIADEEGRFEIPLRPGTYDVVFEGDTEWSPSLAADIPTGKDARLVLEGASTLFGAVRDSEGRAIRSGTVHWAGLLGTVRLHRSAPISSNATYEILGLPSRATMLRMLASAGGASAMRIVAEGYAPTSFEVTAPWPGDGRLSPWKQHVWLTRKAYIDVEVVDDRGDPVSNAEVSLFANGFSQIDDLEDLFGTARQVRATTDAFGMARLAAPAVGATGSYGRVDPEREWAVVPSLERLLPLEYSLFAWSESHGVGARKIEASRERDHVAVRILVPPARRVVGEFVYRDGAPASGIEVTARTKSHPSFLPRCDDPESPKPKAKADDDGIVVFECLPVSSDESVEYVFETSGGKVVDFVFAADPPKTVVDLGTIVLARSEHEPRRMRVLDAEGRPLEGASVLTWKHLDEARERAEIRTDPEGLAPFPVNDCPTIVRALGHAVVMVPPPSEGDPDPVEVPLDRGHVLTGRIAWIAEDGSEGDPYVGPVELRDPEFSMKSSVPPVLGRTVTDAEGRYRIDELPSGEWDLVVTDWRADCSGTRVSTAGENDRILVKRSEAMGRCHVELLSEGRPVVGAVVRLRIDDRVMSFAEVEPGIHVRGGLPTGRYEIDVRHGLYEPKRIPVEIASDARLEMPLELEPSSLLVVTATGPESDRPDTLCLTDMEHGGASTCFDRDSNGEFMVRGIRPGADHRMTFRIGNVRWAPSDAAPLRIESGDSDRRRSVEIVRASRAHFGGVEMSTRRFEEMTPDERDLLREQGASCEVEIVGPDGALWFSGSVESLIRAEFLTLPPGVYRCVETICGEPGSRRETEFRIDLDVQRIPQLRIGEP